MPFGFKAPWGTEVSYPQLIAAANMCDEGVPLFAGGFEPRYKLEGTFPPSMKRGNVPLFCSVTSAMQNKKTA